MKSISFVLTLLLSSALAAPFESTYSSLSAREEAGLFDDLKGGSLGPRAGDDNLVARATADLDEFLASLGGQEKRDSEAPSKREEALLNELLGALGGLTGGSGGAGGLTKGVTDTVGGATGGLTGGAGGLTKELTGKLGDATGGLTGAASGSAAAGDLPKGLTEKLDDLAGGKSGEDGSDKKESDKQKREEAIAGLPISLNDLLSLLGGLGKREEAIAGLPISVKDLLDPLGGLSKSGKQGLSKREEAIAGLPLSLEDLLGLLGGLGKREEAIAGLPISLSDLLGLLGLGKRDEELSKREVAGLGRILSLNLLPLSKGSGKREEPKTEELVDPIIANGGVAEGRSVERRDPIVLTPELINALRQRIEDAKKGKTNNKDKANGKDKRETANHHEAAGVSTDELKKIVAAILSGDIKLLATDPIKKAAEDKAGEAQNAAKDASGKIKEAATAVDPVSA